MNSELLFSKTNYLTKARDPSLSYYLLIAEDRKNGFMSFPRVLTKSKMPRASSRIWTQVADSISYADNHYAKSTYISLYM